MASTSQIQSVLLNVKPHLHPPTSTSELLQLVRILVLSKQKLRKLSRCYWISSRRDSLMVKQHQHWSGAPDSQSGQSQPMWPLPALLTELTANGNNRCSRRSLWCYTVPYLFRIWSGQVAKSYILYLEVQVCGRTHKVKLNVSCSPRGADWNQAGNITPLHPDVRSTLLQQLVLSQRTDVMWDCLNRSLKRKINLSHMYFLKAQGGK